MNGSVKATLVISLALNVLLAGMLLGDVSQHLLTPQPFDLSSQISRLAPAKRALFENIIGAAKQQMDAERAKMDDAKKEALRILKAEPFNESAYMTQVRHIDDIHDQMKRHLAESVAKLAKELTPQEREILANIVSHTPFAPPPACPPAEHTAQGN